MINNKKILIITFAKQKKKKKEKGEGQHMDSCIYEPVLLYNCDYINSLLVDI